jgi:hypothetical protein
LRAEAFQYPLSLRLVIGLADQWALSQHECCVTVQKIFSLKFFPQSAIGFLSNHTRVKPGRQNIPHW